MRLHAGSSYLSSEDPGSTSGSVIGSVPEVRVRWPGGEETVVENVKANQVLEVDAPRRLVASSCSSA